LHDRLRSYKIIIQAGAAPGVPFTIHYCTTRGRKAGGQVLVLVVIALTILLAFAALTIDFGAAYAARRQMQTAADAAAIAGANALLGSNSDSYQEAAKQVASLNGYADGQNNVTVTVGPPASPPNPATGQYVEADITRYVPVYFLSVLGYRTLKISVRAVAGTVGSQNCVYALDRSAEGAISLTGNFSLNSSCGVIDDSSSASALSATGNGNVNTTSTGIAGNYAASGSVTFTPTPQTGIASVPDPLAAISPPTVSACTQASSTHSGADSISGIYSTLSLGPTVYSDGITISGNITTLNFTGGTYGNGISFSGNITTANFNPGQYQNGGGRGASITLNGNITTANFTAGSYTFCGPLSISGNNTVTLQPGLYAGGISITGNANVTFSAGTYILAGGGLTITGNATIQGTGVTFYNTSSTGFAYAPINITGNATLSLSAPTSGSLEGILFFQDRSIATGSAASTVVGNSSSTFDGTLYFPTTGLTYLGNSSVSEYTIIIANTITITGNSSITIGNDYSSLSDGSPIKSTALYE
jgi:putative Flp pilus-assembly TadE/G-like protein